jgi:hypothetical protein
MLCALPLAAALLFVSVGAANPRGITPAELNGAGLLDVVLTDQINAQIFVFFSEP